MRGPGLYQHISRNCPQLGHYESHGGALPKGALRHFSFESRPLLKRGQVRPSLGRAQRGFASLRNVASHCWTHLGSREHGFRPIETPPK